MGEIHERIFASSRREEEVERAQRLTSNAEIANFHTKKRIILSRYWPITTLGTAGIARKNGQAIKHSGNGRLVAVASRTADRAAYIAENQAEAPHDPPPRPVGDYEELPF